MKNIPSFRTLTNWLISNATSKATMANASSLNDPCRFPIVVRPETRAFLSAQSEAFGGSLATFSGNLLDAFAASELESVVYSAELITSRFYMVMKDHRLSLPEAAEVLRELNIGLGDLSTPHDLINKLDIKTLDWISAHFSISNQWLYGSSNTALSIKGRSWYKNLVQASNTLYDLAISENEITLWIIKQQNIDYNDPDSQIDEGPMMSATEFVPVICHHRKCGGVRTYTTYEVWETGRWSYRPSRHHLKILVHFAFRLSSIFDNFTVIGKLMDKDDYNNLLVGSIMPAHVLGKARLESWYPDQFVATDRFACEKDELEWGSIRNQNNEIFRYFDEKLKILPS